MRKNLVCDGIRGTGFCWQKVGMLFLSLGLAGLSLVFLISVFDTKAVTASSGKDLNWFWGRNSLPAEVVTTTVQVTKTVEPAHPDTGGVISICFTISGMKPHNLDVVLVQDVSASMTNPVQAGATLTRLLASQIAAETFVNFLPETDRVAVVSYSTFARLAQPLTTAKGSVTQTIYGLTLDAWTNIGEGINVSHQELISSPRYLSETVKAIILLTDGQANRPVDEPTAAQYARERATAAANSGIKIYSLPYIS